VVDKHRADQLTELKARHESRTTELEGILGSTVQEWCKTQESLTTRSNELAAGQRDDEHLTEQKSRLEGQIADLEGKLASTEQMEGSLLTQVHQARLSSSSCSRRGQDEE
jgi:chromosome segregation ATPase